MTIRKVAGAAGLVVAGVYLDSTTLLLTALLDGMMTPPAASPNTADATVTPAGRVRVMWMPFITLLTPATGRVPLVLMVRTPPVNVTGAIGRPVWLVVVLFKSVTAVLWLSTDAGSMPPEAAA